METKTRTKVIQVNINEWEIAQAIVQKANISPRFEQFKVIPTNTGFTYIFIYPE